MAAFSVERALRLPVRLHGIQLGHAVDLLLDADEWRALGFDVRCGDEVNRFLPVAAARVRDDEIGAGSALMLLEDIGFYRTHGRSVRALLGEPLAGAGTLRDVVVEPGGAVAELVLEEDGNARRVALVDGTIPQRDAA